MSNISDTTHPNIIRQHPVQFILLGVSLFFSLAAFSGGLLNQYGRWLTQDEYSHGFLIPAISLWMLWDRREALAASIGKPMWAGFAVILVSGFMLLVGELSAIFILVQTGFILSLLGISLVFGGMALLRLTALPILFLLFAIPMPYFLDSIMSWRLQLISSELGVFFIRLMSIPVFLEGNVIDLGSYKLQVVDACSGLRYLYPLTSLGFLVAYLFKAPFWQRAIVFISTVPITIFMNSFRIGMVGVLVEYWGGGMADGLLHYFEGWVIFMACAAILCGEVWLFTKFTDGGDFFELFDLPEIVAKPLKASEKGENILPIAFTAGFMILATFGILNITDRQEIVPERMRFVSFPSEIDGWESRKTYLEPNVEKALGLDDYILADYRSPMRSMPVNLYVAYYSSQRKGISPHSPRVCIPGGGWLITEFDRIEINVRGQSEPMPINRAIIERERDRQLVYYWFDQRGHKMSNEYLMKWYLVKDAIFRNRTDGSLVRLTTPIFEGEEVQDAEKRIQTFLDEIAPDLPSYLPN
ncbi:MAG: VPLPA-CTERM-specific exosortase XrtD [Alphaproteobacteria bacterium]|nr:VPLPA-CTERM-specific exosortase XrtD [Alphaproteobacteria bacterium]